MFGNNVVLVALIFSLFITGCVQSATTSQQKEELPKDESVNAQYITYNKAFTINVNQTAILSGNDGLLLIRLVNVEDSRCPESVYCVWEGELRTTILVTRINSSAKAHVDSVIFDTNTYEDINRVYNISLQKVYWQFGTVTDTVSSSVGANINIINTTLTMGFGKCPLNPVAKLGNYRIKILGGTSEKESATFIVEADEFCPQE